MRDFNIIVALDQNNGIGKDGKMPWNISSDLKHFKAITSNVSERGKMNVVIMGRKTWESIPKEFRPLKDRINVVLTKNTDLKFPQNVMICDSFKKAIELFDVVDMKDKIDQIFVIGGAQVFGEAIRFSNCKKIYVTHVNNVFECDTFFPPYTEDFKQFSLQDAPKNQEISLKYAQYIRK